MTQYVDFYSSIWKSLKIQLRKPRVNILSDVTRSKRARTAREFHTFIIYQLEFDEAVVKKNQNPDAANVIS